MTSTNRCSPTLNHNWNIFLKESFEWMILRLHSQILSSVIVKSPSHTHLRISLELVSRPGNFCIPYKTFCIPTYYFCHILFFVYYIVGKYVILDAAIKTFTSGSLSESVEWMIQWTYKDIHVFRHSLKLKQSKSVTIIHFKIVYEICKLKYADGLWLLATYVNFPDWKSWQK